jgi:hypothetical protein
METLSIEWKVSTGGRAWRHCWLRAFVGVVGAESLSAAVQQMELSVVSKRRSRAEVRLIARSARRLAGAAFDCD